MIARDELNALPHQDDARRSGVEVSAGSVWVAPVFGMEDHCELISRSKKTENCALDLRCNWITEAAAFDQQAADRRATPGVEADAAYLRTRPCQKQATCPVCLCELSSPIFQCQNGHLICGPCLERPNTTTHGRWLDRHRHHQVRYTFEIGWHLAQNWLASHGPMADAISRTLDMAYCLLHGAECAPTVCTYVHVDAFVSARSHSSVSARSHSSVSARSLRNKVDALQAELWSLRSRRKHGFLVSLVLLYRDPGLRWAEVLWRESGGRYIFVADDGHCRNRRSDARIG